MRTLAELQSLCDKLDLSVETNGRRSKGPYVAALQEHYWSQDHGGKTLPEQTQPMLLSDWRDLSDELATEIEADDSGWVVQQKLDGMRVLVHITEDGVRITGRSLSTTKFRLCEYQAHVPHLVDALRGLIGTILDAELICPIAELDTSNVVTTSALQAVVALTSTTPDEATQRQAEQSAHLQLHVFDILSSAGEDISGQPLRARLDYLATALRSVASNHILQVPHHAINKCAIHAKLIENGAEGTVWKRLDSSYQANRRSKHWIKRKRAERLELIAVDYKLGTPGRGHENLIGAVGFASPNDPTTVVAWVSAWPDEERSAMSSKENERPSLSAKFLGRRALIESYSRSMRSGRWTHARCLRWI